MRLTSLSIFVYVLVALAITVSPAYAQTESDTIRSLLEDRDAEIKRLLGQSDDDVDDATREQLRVVVNEFIDFQAMGKAALGPHWDDLAESQRSDFVAVFSDIVRRQSLADLGPYRASVEYGAITVEGSKAHVVTSTVVDDVPMTVEYELIRSGDSWRAEDIILDEVSTVGGYSRSFQTMVRKKGFDVLMERLRKRQDSLAQTG